MDNKPPYTPPTPQNNPAPNGGNNVIYSSAPNGVVTNGMPKRPSKGRLFAIAGAAAVVVIGTAGYVFGFYIPNKPENVFKSALTNTGKGYDELVNYLDDEKLEDKFKTSSVDGTFKLESADFSTDGTFKGAGDEKNATFSGDIGLGTTRLTVEGVAKDVDSSESPDLYLKLGGIKGLGESFGMPELDTLDNQWVTLDHSLIDSYVNMAESAGGLESADTMKAPTQEQTSDGARVIGEVSKKYLFTDDEANAVLEMKEYVGKETVDGKETNHYKVKVNKDRLKAFYKELGEQLDKSKLNDWAKEAYDKDLSKLIDSEGMQKSVDDIKDTDTFDIWVNTDTKLIHKVRFSETKNPADNYMELGLNYAGGDEKPLFLNFSSNQDGSDTSGSLKFNINTKTDVFKIEADIEQKGDSDVAMNLKAEIKPGASDFKAEAPEGAITLSEAFARVGLGDYLELFNQSLESELNSEATLNDAELAPYSIEQ
jgi:hypothetical protein